MQGRVHQQYRQDHGKECENTCFDEELDGEGSSTAAQYFSYPHFFGSPDRLCGRKIDKIDHCQQKDKRRNAGQDILGGSACPGIAIQNPGIKMNV